MRSRARRAGGGSFLHTRAARAWLNACGDGAAVAALAGIASDVRARERTARRHRAGAPDITAPLREPEGREAVPTPSQLRWRLAALCVRAGYVKAGVSQFTPARWPGRGRLHPIGRVAPRRSPLPLAGEGLGVRVAGRGLCRFPRA